MKLDVPYELEDEILSYLELSRKDKFKNVITELKFTFLIKNSFRLIDHIITYPEAWVRYCEMLNE
jgi:hypothetical protein